MDEERGEKDASAGQEQTGLATGFRPAGLFEVAANAARREESRRGGAFTRHSGLGVNELVPPRMSGMVLLPKTWWLGGGVYWSGDVRV